MNEQELDPNQFLAEAAEVELPEMPAVEPAPTPAAKGKGDDKKKDSRFSNCKTVEIEVDAEEALGGDAEAAEKQKKTVRIPLTIPEIVSDLSRRTGGWPRRIGQGLFYDNQGKIAWLCNPASLFGYINNKVGRVDWFGGVGSVKQSEFYEHLRNTAEQYEAIEQMPHFPPMAGHYYACKTPPLGNGKALEGLLDFYRPSTPHDRQLLKASVVTQFWGGSGGSRPIIVVTSSAGRGAGKTKTVESIAYVGGGHFDVNQGEDIQQVKTRLLTMGSLAIRAINFDNVKSHKFSNADYEGLVTCRIISGRALYIGDATRPNVLTYFMTLNGVSLSNDLAQRSVIIKIDKGENFPGWFETVLDYIEANRQAIIGDCAAFLNQPEGQLKSYSRWASWERGILSRLEQPDELQRLIMERQGESDADADEAEIIEQYVGNRLEGLGYDPERDVVRLPVAVAGEWYGNALRERVSVTKASRRLSQIITEGKMPRLSKDAGRSHGRAFIWSGEFADFAAQPAGDVVYRLSQYSQSDERRAF